MSTPQHTPGDERPGTTSSSGPEPTGSVPDPANGPGATAGKSSQKPGDNPLRGSRTSGMWAAVVALGLLLVLLVVFIAQNTDTTTVRFLGFQGETPVAVALLIATAAGILLTAIAGSLRILQLRRRTKRDLKGR